MTWCPKIFKNGYVDKNRCKDASCKLEHVHTKNRRNTQSHRMPRQGGRPKGKEQKDQESVASAVAPVLSVSFKDAPAQEGVLDLGSFNVSAASVTMEMLKAAAGKETIAGEPE